jgi:hypothetical protein
VTFNPYKVNRPGSQVACHLPDVIGSGLASSSTRVAGPGDGAGGV